MNELTGTEVDVHLDTGPMEKKAVVTSALLGGIVAGASFLAQRIMIRDTFKGTRVISKEESNE